MQNLIVLLALILSIIAWIYQYFQHKKVVKKFELELQKLGTDLKFKDQKVFEGQFILGLDDRITHSVNVKKTLDSISDTLSNITPFTAVSYVLTDGVKLYYRSFLNESVSNAYVEDIKKRLLSELKALLGYDLEKRKLDESVLGQFVDNENKAGVRSFYTVTLSMGSESIGLFNISSTAENAFDESKKEIIQKILNRAMDNLYNITETVRKGQTRISYLIDSMKDCFIIVDKNLNIVQSNTALYELLKMQKNSKLTFFDLSGYFSSAFPLEEKINNLFNTGNPEHFQDIKVADKYLHMSFIPVKTSDIIDFVGIIIHDVTYEEEYKRTEMEFTAMMVHELRSPLTVIRGTSDMLIKNLGTLTQEQTTGLLNQMKTSSSNLLELVNDLLDTAKAEAGKLQLSKSYNDINKMLHDEADYYKNSAMERGLTFVVEADSSIEVINFDPEKLKQVLNNLISNSLKFTERGGTLTLTSKRYPAYAEISVSDTGKGLSDAAKAKLFSKFMQFKDRNTSEKGTGLGLVITKGIVEAHGGRIWVEDNLPKGAKFIFTLPL